MPDLPDFPESIPNPELRGTVEIASVVPRALWARVKSAAAFQGRAPRHLLADALEMYVSAFEQQQKKKASKSSEDGNA